MATARRWSKPRIGKGRIFRHAPTLGRSAKRSKLPGAGKFCPSAITPKSQVRRAQSLDAVAIAAQLLRGARILK